MTHAFRNVLILSIIVIVLGAGSALAACPIGDLNQDCTVDWFDLQILGQYWLADPNAVADLNGDEKTDGADFFLFAEHWRQTGCPIVVNELLAHSHAVAPDWIELQNVSDLFVDISGWWLSDERGEPNKYQIAPGIVLEPFGYVVFYENTHFGNPLDPGAHIPFALSENGETLYLSAAPDSPFADCRVAELFGPSATGNAFGRHEKSTGTSDFVTVSWSTPGADNAYPLVGPIVINEIMYHPADDGDAEYVELLNISDGPITLCDFASMEPWRFGDDSGIDFWFPSDNPVTLQANEHLLLVRDTGAFGSNELPTNIRILEWNSGRLSNAGEMIRLLKPGDVDDLGTRYWIELDRVDYSDGSRPEDFPYHLDPWPEEADGQGLSLNRLFASRYGNDPNNWHATIPTPGSTND